MVLALVAAVALVGAQGSHQVAKTAPAVTSKVSGLFWKATSPTTTIYMLGSIHIGSKEMYPLPKYIEDDFKKSSALVVEVNLTQLDTGKLMQLLTEKGRYPEGDNLYNHVSKETEKQIKALCAKYSFPEVMFSGMRPWMASMMAQVMPLMSEGMKADLGIDNHFMAEANETKKPIEQVETAEFQLNLLASMPEEVQDAYLASVVKQTAATGGSGTNKLVSEWIAGDGSTIEGSLDDSSGMSPEFARKLLQDRNVHMTEVAEKFLKGTKPCFLVVGAAHFLGKEGIVASLRQHGFVVQQVLNK